MFMQSVCAFLAISFLFKQTLFFFLLRMLPTNVYISLSEFTNNAYKADLYNYTMRVP